MIGTPAAINNSRILIVDDEAKILHLMPTVLQQDGDEVIAAQDGSMALQALEKDNPELIILDIYIPKIDGYELCRRIRKERETPIFVVSGRATEEGKLQAFGLGADDFLAKPFALAELLAHVRAVLRRVRPQVSQAPKVSRFAQLEINYTARLVKCQDRVQELTPIEYSLLGMLTLNAGKALTHEMLLNQAWGPEYADEREYLRVHISHLRHKIEPDPANPEYIQTIPRIGYRFAKEPGASNNR